MWNKLCGRMNQLVFTERNTPMTDNQIKTTKRDRTPPENYFVKVWSRYMQIKKAEKKQAKS